MHPIPGAFAQHSQAPTGRLPRMSTRRDSSIIKTCLAWLVTVEIVSNFCRIASMTLAIDSCPCAASLCSQ